MKKIKPRPPKWALAAGLPAPTKGEDYIAYVIRLGLNPDWLLEGLTDRTSDLARLRLEGELARTLPDVYAEYLTRRVEAGLR